MKPDIWDHEGLGKVAVEAQLLYIGLITQADDDGRLRGPAPTLRGHIWPYKLDQISDEDVDGWLSDLAKESLIVRYEAGGMSYIELVDWHNHQKISHPRPSVFPAPPETPQSGIDKPNRNHSGAPPERLRSASALIGREGSGREGSGEGTSENPTTARNNSPEVIRLCELLADLIAENGSKRPDPERWRNDCRLTIEQDDRTPEQIEAAVRWAQGNEFWRANALSMAAIRRNWDKMRLQAARKKGKAAGNAAVLRMLEGTAA